MGRVVMQNSEPRMRNLQGLLRLAKGDVWHLLKFADELNGMDVQISVAVVQRFVMGILIDLGWSDEEIAQSISKLTPLHPVTLTRVKNMRSKKDED